MKNICSFCLKTLNEFMSKHLDQSIIEMMTVIKISLQHQSIIKPVICKSCLEKLEKAFQFKSMWLTKEETFVLMNSSNKNKIELSTCRFCTTNSLDNISLPKELYKHRYEKIFNRHFNERQLYSTQNSLICQKCIEKLYNFVKFLEQCTYTNEKILTLLKQRNIMEKINLFEVLDENENVKEFVIKTEDKNNHNFECLTEEYIIKSEPLDDEFVDNETRLECETKAEPNQLIPKIEMCCLENQVSSQKKNSENRKKQNDKEETIVIIREILESQKSHKCTICDFQFSTENKLQEHLLVHDSFNEIILFKCEECTFETKTKPDLENHLIKNHEITRKNLAVLRKCKKCGYMSKHKMHFYDHLLKHGVVLKKQIPFKCDKCQFMGSNKSRLQRHILQRHKNDTSTSSIQKLNNLSYKCQDCGFETQYKNSLQRHLIPSKTIVKCTQCDFKTIRLNCLKQHVLHHSSDVLKKYSCETCDYKSSKKYRFEYHILKHKTKTTVHKCLYCSYQTLHKVYLWNHINRVHQASDSYQVFKCSKCNFQTKYKSSLNTHMMVHL